jgi:hypothetical protein
MQSVTGALYKYKRFSMSIPNKIIDALSLGLPIVSPLQGEVMSLISTHGVGRAAAATHPAQDVVANENREIKYNYKITLHKPSLK